jgi:hypothetical protein
MMIQDLETRKELAREELSTVRGGSNYGYVGGQEANQRVWGDGNFSPTTAVNAPVNAPFLFQNDVHPVTKLDLDLATVIGSSETKIS